MNKKILGIVILSIVYYVLWMITIFIIYYKEIY